MRKYFVLICSLFFLLGCERVQTANSLNMDKSFKFYINKGDGKISKINTKDNKVLVLNFFTSTCGGCKEELPGMVKLHEELSKDVNIIGVLGEKIDKKSAMKFLDKYKINFPVLNESKPVKVLSDAIGGVFGVPVTVVYDRKGNVIDKFLGVVPTVTLKKSIKSGI